MNAFKTVERKVKDAVIVCNYPLLSIFISVSGGVVFFKKTFTLITLNNYKWKMKADASKTYLHLAN